MANPETRRMKAQIRKEIYSRGVGAKFTAKDIRVALEEKGIHVDSHAVSSIVRVSVPRWMIRVRKDPHKGYLYQLIRIPKEEEEGE